jgi:hypothetical protein
MDIYSMMVIRIGLLRRHSSSFMGLCQWRLQGIMGL